MLIDSHTHLDHCREDAAVLVADARAAGVGLIIQCGTDLARSRRSVELAGQFPEVVAAVGYHPHEAGRIDDAGWSEVEGWTTHPRVVAVGETGFDYHHDHWPHGVQGEVFVQHLDLARCAGLPVVVHTRDAAEDTLETLADHAQGLTVIMHCFSLPGLLDEVVSRGYYIGFAGNVTYKNALDLQEAARSVPSHLLLLETDAPWLAPMPGRGRPNRPGLVAKTYEFVAGLRGVDVAELAAQLEANVRHAFPRVVTALEAAR
jgi:TatD DNase family protein